MSSGPNSWGEKKIENTYTYTGVVGGCGLDISMVTLGLIINTLNLVSPVVI